MWFIRVTYLILFTSFDGYSTNQWFMSALYLIIYYHLFGNNDSYQEVEIPKILST